MQNVRIATLEGIAGRFNDVLSTITPANDANSTSDRIVVFFGGDVQNLEAEMMKHRDNHKYVRYNLESTCSRLASKFQGHHVLVIRPSLVSYGTFSSYRNFVPSNDIGVPEFQHHNAWEHLHLLIKRWWDTERGAEDSNSSIAVDHIREVKLVGFSKGCVPINQLMYELFPDSAESTCDVSQHSSSSSGGDHTTSLVQAVKDIYWLDGGHSGGLHTWITSRPGLTKAVQTMPSWCKYHVHVTPYQIQDTSRPWIAKEEKLFSKIMKSLLGGSTDPPTDCRFTRAVHREREEQSLEQHFGLFDDFLDSNSNF